jgi:beta-glucosidase
VVDNQVNGTHVAESKDLLEGVLRKEWGHEGIVISDWYGTYSSGEALNAGLDLEFPGPTRWRQKTHFDYLLQVHKVDPRQIDILVTRVLEWVQKMVKGSPDLVYAKDKLEKTRWDDKNSDSKLVRRIVTSGITLLKNDGDILPVRKGKVAVIGPNAKAKVFTGGGSARLQPAWSSTPWEGMVSEKPDGVELEYSVGTLTAKYYPLLDENFTCADGSVGFDGWHYAVTESGEQASKPVGHDQLYRSELRFNNFARKGLGEHWYTELQTTFTSPITGVYEFECTATGKYRFWIDGKLEIEEVDYEEKGTAFYGNGTKEKIVTLDVKQGQVSLLTTSRLMAEIRIAIFARHPTTRECPIPCLFRSAVRWYPHRRPASV